MSFNFNLIDEFKFCADSDTLVQLWTYLTNVFRLNDVHRGEQIIVLIEGETLFIYPEKGFGYRTGT